MKHNDGDDGDDDGDDDDDDKGNASTPSQPDYNSTPRPSDEEDSMTLMTTMNRGEEKGFKTSDTSFIVGDTTH